MKNPMVYYGVIGLGVILLIVGIAFLVIGHHPLRTYVGLGAGVVLIIAGVVGMFVLKPRAVAAAAK